MTYYYESIFMASLITLVSSQLHSLPSFPDIQDLYLLSLGQAFI